MSTAVSAAGVVATILLVGAAVMAQILRNEGQEFNSPLGLQRCNTNNLRCPPRSTRACTAAVQQFSVKTAVMGSGYDAVMNMKSPREALAELRAAGKLNLI